MVQKHHDSQGDLRSMINKDRYTDLLTQTLNEYYKTIKTKKSTSPERQQYIDGYLTAARALGIFGFDELKEIIDKVHYEAFGQTIEERHRAGLIDSSTEEDSLDIPTYIRQGILLEKK